MLRSLFVLGLAALAGCDEVFDLVEVVPTRDGGTGSDADALPDAFIRPGLVAWYPMEDVASGKLADVVGDHEGACIGSACPVPTLGVRGTALLFNGSSQLINTLTTPAVNTRGDFTVALWVRQDAAPVTDDYACAIGKIYGTGAANTWQFCSYMATWAFYSNTNPVIIGPVMLGKWQHFAATWQAATDALVIYVDGVMKTPTPVDVPFDMGRIMIGADDDGAGTINWFPGAIDEVQIYNRVLPPAEILEVVIQ